MFRDLRKQIKTKNFQVLLWIILASFVAAGLAPLLMRQSKQELPWTIKVNDVAISQTEFALEVERQKDLFASFARRLGPMADQLLHNIQETVIQSTQENLIRSVLLNQQARAIGITVDPESVVLCMNNPRFNFYDMRTIIPMQFYQPDGSINYSRVRQYLQRLQLPPDYYERKMEELVGQQQLLELVKLSAYVPTYQLEDEITRTNATRTYDIITIPFAAQLKKITDTQISNKEIESYYLANKQKYTLPEKRSGSIWQFNPVNFNLLISDDMINNYYQEHKQDYIQNPATVIIKDLFIKKPQTAQDLEIVQNRIEELYARAKANPENFSELITQHSQENLNIPNGTKEFVRGQTADKALERAAFILDKDLAISPVVESTDGYHIIQRISKKPATYKPTIQVQPQIKKLLETKEFNKVFANAIRNVLEETKNGSQESLSQFINNKKGEKGTPIVNEIRTDNKQLETLFGIKKIKEFSYYIKDGMGYVVQLTDLQPTTIPSSQSIENLLRTDIKKNKAQIQVKQELEKLKESINHSSQELASLGAVKKTITVNPKDDQQNKKLAESASMPIDQLLKLVIPGTTSIQLTPSSGVLVRLVSVLPLDKALLAEKEQVDKELLKNSQEALTGAFVASLYRNAKIEINQPKIS